VTPLLLPGPKAVKSFSCGAVASPENIKASLPVLLLAKKALVIALLLARRHKSFSVLVRKLNSFCE
jgi:hypothetical protein